MFYIATCETKDFKVHVLNLVLIKLSTLFHKIQVF